MAKAVTASNQSDPEIILSVAEAKAALHVPAAVDIDADLIPNINQAASWVGNQISAPVLDVDRWDDMLPPRAAPGTPDRPAGEVPPRNLPITVFDRRWVREVLRVEWWDTDGNLSSAPNQVITAAQLGRVDILEAGAFQDSLQVFPPMATGWPVAEGTLPGSRLRVHTTAGLTMTEPYAEAIRRAVIEGTKQLQGNEEVIRFNATFEKLLGPLSAV